MQGSMSENIFVGRKKELHDLNTLLDKKRQAWWSSKEEGASEKADYLRSLAKRKGR